MQLIPARMKRISGGLIPSWSGVTAASALARAGLFDLAEGIANWRIWHLMGTAELRRRYARSSIGQFWLTISTAITVVALGLVWSLLWNLRVAEMLPFFAVGYVLWIYITAFFVDATGVFISNGPYYVNQSMSFSTAIYALAYLSIITLGHNLVIVVTVLIFFAIPVNVGILIAFGGLMLITVTGIAAAYLIAMLCARYRDITPIVANAIQIAFFITPVLWQEQQLPVERRWIVDYNPFAVLVSIVRDPVLGMPVPTERWLNALGITVGAVLLALVMVGRYRRRIIYWL